MIFYGSAESENRIFQMVDEHDLEEMEAEAAYLSELLGKDDFCLIPVPVSDWNRDLTPWKADAVFGKTGFGDGAEATLKNLLCEVMPRTEGELSSSGRNAYYLCGYSLAGLFALWAAYRTEVFDGIAAVSPSVWYPGWIGYAKENRILTDHVYLSLGDREEKTRNRTMAAVGDAIREQERILKTGGVPCVLEWNPGNHFQDSGRRCAKGLAWLLRRKTV